MSAAPKPRVALLVTCLVDLVRPSVGFAAVKLLQAAGCQVEVPLQSCCGQPAWNAGQRDKARAVGRTMLDAMEGFDLVVAPSGSCAAMVACHYPALFAGTGDEARARDLAGRCFELTRYLVDIAALDPDAMPGAGGPKGGEVVATWHDSCSCLREAGVDAQPRALLAGIAGLTLKEAGEREVCCGFGGTFAVAYPAISAAMARDKARCLEASGAGLVLGADLGCLLHIAGALKRQGSPLRVRHVAELLAGDDATPAIAEGEGAP